MGRHQDKRNIRKSGHGIAATAARQAGLMPVSDHALVRFLERAGGMDVESVRQSLQIGLARCAAAARSMGSADFVIKMDGHLFVVRGDMVTTVLDDSAEFGEKPLPLGRPQAESTE
jgi:hypothetical protein